MNERREKRKRWVQRGQYAVEVEVEVLYPADDPSEACLEPDTVRWLDEVARKAAEGGPRIPPQSRPCFSGRGTLNCPTQKGTRSHIFNVAEAFRL